MQNDLLGIAAPRINSFNQRRKVFDKILGVSPTQKGLAQDSKIADKKNLQPDFKKDFERQLQKKSDEKSNSLKENVKDSKAKEAKKSEVEFRADHKEKKPSGEIKKKMVEPEAKMISNIMALPKNEFEVPDEKINLATIETDGNSEKAINATDLASQKAEANSISVLENQLSQKLSALSSVETSKIGETESQDFQKPVQEIQIKDISQTAISVQQEKIQQQADQTTEVTTQEISFQDQLSQDVGFQSDLKQHVAAAGLIQKMKEFETEKEITGAKTQDFEQKVLEKLQQDTSALTALSSDSKKDNSESAPDKNGSQSSLKELKADNLKPDANLHAGQTQAEFKNHLSSPLEKTGSPTAMSQLLDKRDENVQELMKQAHFLAIKGGGEMTVKMSPEGMGEIQLKVLMQDGKLNIDMQTQDKSVKKLIEDSLTELKSGLAAQQIHVDHVRITSVNATNTENSAQMHTNQDQSGAQQQQRDFWKNFQDNFGSQSRRSSYGDVAPVKSRGPDEPAALRPISTNAARANGRTGATINRVA